MISSSEVRKRITLLRNTDEREIEKENNKITIKSDRKK
jgi:hypothetical protein